MKHRIAWDNDDDKISDDVYEWKGCSPDGDRTHLMPSTGQYVTVPTLWLRPAEPDLPEPGHVWWRWEGKEYWRHGLCIMPQARSGERELISEYGVKIPMDSAEILPAHTTPPDGKPTYARRWEELSNQEQKDFCHIVLTTMSRPSSKHVYDMALRLASLPTLRSAADFAKDELIEIRRAYQGTPVHSMADFRATAAKSIEIAKRSTS